MRKNQLTKFVGMSLAVALAFSSMTVCAAEDSVYTTQKDDNLSKIAQKVYGDKTRWKDIYEANKDVIKEPNKIWANQQLVIPGGIASIPEQPAQLEQPVQPVQETPAQDMPVQWETSVQWKAAAAAAPSYVEQNGLTFYQGTAFQTQGYRYNADNLANFEFIGADGSINSIAVRDAEKEGYQIVTVSSSISGTAAVHDGGEDELNAVGLPDMDFCDAYTGRMLPTVDTLGDVELVNTTDLMWGDISYSIDHIQEVQWVYGDWSEWMDGDAYALHTAILTNTFVIPKGYDGLAFKITPYTEGPNTDTEYNVFKNNESYILDNWKEGSYLMRVSDLYNILNGQ